MTKAAKTSGPQTNAEIARRLTEVAQMLQAKNENPFKIKAYRRAAEIIAGLSTSIDEEVRAGADLTAYPGIGKGIASALREIVLSGKLGQLEMLLAAAPPEVAALNEHPRLDPKRVARAYKKLKIGSVAELQERLASGEVGRVLGLRMEQHFRGALTETKEMLLADVEPRAAEIEAFLSKKCGVTAIQAVGALRRRAEVIGELSFVIACPDFAGVVQRMERYGGGTKVMTAEAHRAVFQLSQGLRLTLQAAPPNRWGLFLVAETGSKAHLERLAAETGLAALAKKTRASLPDEESVYQALGLQPIEPELREGHDEVALARARRLPRLVTGADIRGELHAHTTSSDGSQTIEEMAAAARALGYEYLGISDHSQSLKIARGVSEDNLWLQLRAIDRLNTRGLGIRLLKSAEVDILTDGTLDYPDALLKELDYTVCSIHSKFRLNREEQTARIMRAMDHPYFSILGHATGRLLLRRPGYEIDLDRIIPHAKARGVAFEINASPDRLDLSAEQARLVSQAGIKIAICTDAHHIREFENVRFGVDVARRAGMAKEGILNALPWAELQRALKR